MNIQEYISSGIIESYVLGLASPDERAEFERMCAAHSEVRLAREAFEIELENFALANAVNPPKNLRSQVFAELEIEKGKDNSSYNSSANSAVADSGTVIKMNPVWRYVAAASVILLITSAALNIYFFRQYKSYSARYDALATQYSDLVQQERNLNTRFQEYESALSKMTDTGMAIVRMEGLAVKTSPAPASAATIYWDKKSKDVYLHVNNMPEPGSGKQYQLWALVDGAPVDAGIFDMKTDLPMIKMKNIPHAQGFAVTLEPLGGSPRPTMEQMYVLGLTKQG